MIYAYDHGNQGASGWRKGFIGSIRCLKANNTKKEWNAEQSKIGVWNKKRNTLVEKEGQNADGTKLVGFARAAKASV
jgi:hypothetical protein